MKSVRLMGVGVYGGNDFLEKIRFSLEWKSEGVTGDDSGDDEGEEDWLRQGWRSGWIGKFVLLEVFNHICSFKNHFPHFGVHTATFQQRPRSSELRRNRIGEVHSVSIGAPSHWRLSGRRWKMIDVLIVVVAPPRWMTQRIEADHL